MRNSVWELTVNAEVRGMFNCHTMSLSEYSCKVCIIEVENIDHAVLCNLCENWIYADDAGIGEIQNENQKECPLLWYWSYCIMELPFSSTRNKNLQILLNGSSQLPIKSPRKQKNWKNFWNESNIWTIWQSN